MRPELTRIEPKFMPRIWGAHSLAPIYPDKTNLPEPIGETWLTGPESKIETGPLIGPLHQAWQKMPPAWRGTEFKPDQTPREFPLLVKFLFPTDQLSVQVHPDDAYAKNNEAPGAVGKTEMWHVVSAEPGATLLLGLVPEVDREKFRSAINQGGLENFFDCQPVSASDTFYVPSGTPHTIGAGMILCEVQQNSDLTYRLYDFHRVDAKGNPRELHLTKAMAVIDFDHRKGGKVSPVALPSADGAKKSLLVACPYFATERWDLRAQHRANSDPAHFELLVILSGRGTIQWTGGSSSYRQGECWFIPANLGQLSIVPESPTSILRTYVPSITTLRNDLSRNGVPNSAIEQVIFT
ncbi:MAG TPA: type I phosphomannose isomerase catalytic subunit [Candidatus Acidoferrum sp.]|nr:type I phosphomannose isomerase catalytic subunit [Candidatus Acidoferrum sp.]